MSCRGMAGSPGRSGSDLRLSVGSDYEVTHSANANVIVHSLTPKVVQAAIGLPAELVAHADGQEALLVLDVERCRDQAGIGLDVGLAPAVLGERFPAIAEVDRSPELDLVGERRVIVVDDAVIQCFKLNKIDFCSRAL